MEQVKNISNVALNLVWRQGWIYTKLSPSSPTDNLSWTQLLSGNEKTKTFVFHAVKIIICSSDAPSSKKKCIAGVINTAVLPPDGLMFDLLMLKRYK